MKKFRIILLLFVGFQNFLVAQRFGNERGLYIYGGPTGYSGSYGTSVVTWPILESNHFGVELSRKLSNKLDYSLGLENGVFQNYKSRSDRNFSSGIANIHLSALVSVKKFNPKAELIALGGLSMIGYFKEVNGSRFVLTPGIRISPGFRFRYNDYFTIRTQLTALTAFNSKIDRYETGRMDLFLMPGIGLEFTFLDKIDINKLVTSTQKVSVPNINSEIVSDLDKDGIPDVSDSCIQIPGLIWLSGCPDKDGDGIPDSRDLCPEIAGSRLQSGCPDKDGDGVDDMHDSCPEKAGILSKSGCPEMDSDRLTSGSISDESSRMFSELNELPYFNIQFASGLSYLTDSSIQSVKFISDHLKRHPGLKVRITGHADATGPEILNRKISLERALAVKRKLIESGVNADRIKVLGAGSLKPIASNHTQIGRKKNRRIDVTFE